MPVKKKYKLIVEDFINFTNYAVKRALFFQLVVMTIVAFVTAGLIAGSENFWIVSIISVIVVAVIMTPVTYWSARRRTVKNFNSYKFADEEIETAIDKRGFSQKSSIGHTKVPFDKLYKICESKYGIYVYVSSRQAIILSKKDFTVEEIEIMKDLFRNNMPLKKLKLMK